MLKPYKKYTITTQCIDESTKKVFSFQRVINLFDVDTYASVDNEFSGFNDKLKRTSINLINGFYYHALIPFEDFDVIFTDVMTELRLMHDNLDKKKEDLIPFEAKWKYRGEVKHSFVRTHSSIACRVMPKNYNLVGKSFEEMMANSIDSNIIHLS